MHDGEDKGSVPHERGKRLWRELSAIANTFNTRSGRRLKDPQSHRACLMRAVSSCTRLYTERSSRMSRVILDVAWITVV